MPEEEKVEETTEAIAEETLEEAPVETSVGAVEESADDNGE